jgi:hypothetical protein
VAVIDRRVKDEVAAPPATPEWLYLAVPTPGAVESHMIVVLEGALARVGGVRPDLATGRVQILMAEL